MRLIALIFCLLTATLFSASGRAATYMDTLQPAAMKSDFSYLRSRLEVTFPALYVHQSRERMQWIMDSLGNTLQQPLPFLEFYKKIAFLIAEIRCEHSYCNPGGRWDAMLQTFRYLPFQLFLGGERPFVLVNCTTDTTIHPGDEIVSINGRAIDRICREIYRYIPSDGFMTDSKAYGLSSMMFGVAYNLYIEQPAAYTVIVKTRAGKLIQKDYNHLLSLSELNQLALANPVNKPVLDADKQGKELNKREYWLEWPEPGTALLNARSFSLDIPAFKAATDSFFTAISAQKADRLVIDLRDNGGGEEELAAYLMSYLLDTPTRFMESEYLITDADSVLVHCNIPDEMKLQKYTYIEPLKNGRSYARITAYSRELEMMQPKPNGFHGKVYLLVSGITSSAASTFAAVARSNHRAVILGQETAGSFSGGGTVLGLDLTLPHSGIHTHTSIVYQEFATHGRDGNRGVIPDRRVVPAYEDLIGSDAHRKERILQMLRD